MPWRTDIDARVTPTRTVETRDRVEYVRIAIAFLASYVLLDWASSPPEFSLVGITPWNPTVGLAFALVLRRGLPYAPLLLLAQICTMIVVRETPFDAKVWLAEAILLAVVYAGALAILMHPAQRFDAAFNSLRDVLLLLGTAVVAPAVVAALYTGGLLAAGFLAPADAVDAALRYWIADAIGIVSVTPGLLLVSRRSWPTAISLSTALQATAIIAALIVVFGVAGPAQPKLYYILVLPVVWIAVRQGIEGAALALMLIQFAMLIALYAGREPGDGVTAVQVFLLVLSVSALVIGELITERSRTERRLRLQQDAIGRAARLGSMGELAAALAHELNQPLTAIGNYARALDGAISRGPEQLPAAREAAGKIVRQVERAAEVIRRLRAFIQVGRMEVEPHRVQAIIDETLDVMHPELSTLDAEVVVELERGLPRVMVDLIQVEQVLMNLIRNGAEAARAAGTTRPSITIGARTIPSGLVELSVTDNGPGFPSQFRLGATSPMATSKAEGLGIGLMLCESIVEAHGGKLKVANGPAGGATVRFTVPAAAQAASVAATARPRGRDDDTNRGRED